MKYKQVIKNGLCKKEPDENSASQNKGELRVFKSCAKAVDNL